VHLGEPTLARGAPLCPDERKILVILIDEPRAPWRLIGDHRRVPDGVCRHEGAIPHVAGMGPFAEPVGRPRHARDGRRQNRRGGGSRELSAAA